MAQSVFDGAQADAVTRMVVDDAVKLRLGYLLQLEDLVLLLLQALQGVLDVTALRLNDKLRGIVAHAAEAVPRGLVVHGLIVLLI